MAATVVEALTFPDNTPIMVEVMGGLTVLEVIVDSAVCLGMELFLKRNSLILLTSKLTSKNGSK